MSALSCRLSAPSCFFIARRRSPPEPGSVSSKTAHAPTPASGGSLRPEAAACRPTTGSPRVVRLKGPYEAPTASPASPAAPGSDSLSASFPSSHCAALDALPPILLLGRRSSHHTPDLVLSILVTDQHGQ